MTTNVRVGASTNEVRLSLVEESVWGETPASPAFTNFRLTGENLQPGKETVTTSEIRSDRNVSETLMVAQSAAGNIDFEVSYGTLDDLFKSALFSDWAGSPANTMINGVDDTAFTVERRTPLAGGGFSYDWFTGLIVNTMSLNIQSRQIVTGSMAFMGRRMLTGSSAPSGATYADANQSRIMTAATSVGSLEIAGLSPAPRIRNLTLEINNNLRVQDEIGNLYNAGLAPGDFMLTGTLEAYFSTGALAQAYLDHDDIGLSFLLGDDPGSRYRFRVPTIKLTGDLGKNAGSKDADVMLTLSWEANLDRTSGGIAGMLEIERDV